MSDKPTATQHGPFYLTEKGIVDAQDNIVWSTDELVRWLGRTRSETPVASEDKRVAAIKLLTEWIEDAEKATPEERAAADASLRSVLEAIDGRRGVSAGERTAWRDQVEGAVWDADHSPHYVLARDMATILDRQSSAPSSAPATPGMADACIDAAVMMKDFAPTTAATLRRVAALLRSGNAPAAPSAVSANAGAIPDVLFDGYAVYKALGEDGGVSHRNVAAVLDAVVRLIRSQP